MSVPLPVCAVVFGAVAPPQTDILELKVHLGATKEVSSFSCLLQNFNKKYSPGGTYPINVDDDGSISAGRNPDQPLLITLRVEETRLESTSAENYIRVRGRCWGEKLFRRLITKTYENMKGEAIVKDLIDFYVGLSHVRDSTELIEDTDTTYTRLEYENTHVFDILKYIASTADKAGVIGYDFRVAPDAKFEFFPRNSKTSSVSLSERLEVSEYEKSIFRKRDKIFVYGAAEKALPTDKDAWTESLTPADGAWSVGGGGSTLSLDSADKIMGSYSIKTSGGTGTVLIFTLNAGKEVNCNLYPSLTFQLKPASGYPYFTIQLEDTVGMIVRRHLQVSDGEWSLQTFAVGKDHSDEWEHSVFNSQPFDWGNVKKLGFYISTVVGVDFRVDNLFFNHCRWNATYGSGQRELAETDEELHSDNECLLRAKALYDYLSSPAEYIKVTSDVIDYGTTPILAGDRIWVTLPNENINGYYRVISAEYYLRASDQTLEATLELGKEPMLLADYLYALRSKTGSLARYKIGRI